MTAPLGDDDAALVARTLAGDAGAYASLLRRYFDAAYGVARRLTACDEDAEDACQEAFARAYFRLDRCGEPARFRGWLMQVVRHQAHNVRRGQALRAATALGDIADPPAPPGPARDAELGGLRTALVDALAALPKVKCSVVQRHDVDGWTHPQIAAALGISVVMSRRHLSDARALLRARLGVAAVDFLSEDVADD